MSRKRILADKCVKFIFAIVIATSVCSCDDRPDGVISRGRMADLLYDYHIVQGMCCCLPMDSIYLVDVYMKSVFENNGVTEEEFDSSMIYYYKHRDQLADIYSEIMDRIAEEEGRLARTIGSSDMIVFSENGDTANIWAGRQLYVLRNEELMNKNTFRIKCDSNFYRHDQFILEASVGFIRENMEDRNFYTTLCLSLEYKNGKVISQILHLCNEGKQRLQVKAVDDEDLKSLYGFFYYEGKPGGRNISLVRDISLWRMHEKVDTTKAAEAQADTTANVNERLIPAPDMEEKAGKALTPEEKRELSIGNNESDRKVEILEAPKVRTPNRDMRRRKRR